MGNTTITTKMSDGTICRSGPNCRLHGNKNKINQLSDEITKTEQKFIKQTLTILPSGNTRQGLNKINPDWAEDLYKQSSALRKNVPEEIQYAVESYTYTRHDDINSYLREGEKSIHRRLDSRRISEKTINDAKESVIKQISHIDEAFSANETKFEKPMVLYRGIKIDKNINDKITNLQYVKENFKIGQIIEDKAYVSTSADPDYMTFFGRSSAKKKGPHMVYEIVAKKGLPILHNTYKERNASRIQSSIQTYEREVLLNRGTKFKVIGIKNVTFINSYDDIDDYFAKSCPKKITFPVIQLEQL